MKLSFKTAPNEVKMMKSLFFGKCKPQNPK
jgi:hypothetical protein